MAQGSGGYGGPNFGAIENSLRNIALSYGAIMSAQSQIFASINAWRSLERELTLANAAAGGTRAEFQALEQASRNFALATTFSASQVGQAFYSLASAGFSVKESLQAATGVVLLAQATLTDLGEASDTTASTLQQFNLASYESYRVANLFVAATNNSLATMSKLSFALRQVGPIAAQANLSLEDTVTLLDSLFDVGLRGEQAGTALRNSLTKLMNPVGDGGLILKNLGVNLIDEATGKMRDYIKILEDISKFNLGNEAIIQLVGVEAAAGFAAQLQAVKKGADGANSSLDEHRKKITGTNDAYSMAVQQMQTLDGQLALTANSFNDLRITIGQGLAPLLIELMTSFRSLVQDIKMMNGEQILAYVNMGLMAGSFLIAGKGLTTLIGGMARGIIHLRNMSRAADAATASLRLMGAVGAFGGMLAGLAGLAVAAWAVYEAFNASADAADNLRTKNVGGALLEQQGKKMGMTASQQKNFGDLSNYMPVVRQEVEALDTAYMFNKDTGEGATQNMKMRLDTISRLEAKFQLEDQKVAVLAKQIDANRANWKMLIDSTREYYEQSSMNTLVGEAGGGSVEGQLLFLTNLEGDEKAKATQAQAIIGDLVALAGANETNAKALVNEYFTKRLNDINNLANVSKAKKDELRKQAEIQADKMLRADPGGLAVFLKSIGESAEREQEKIVERGGYDNAFFGVGGESSLNSYENILEQGYDNATKQLDLSVEQYKQMVADVANRKKILENTIAQERGKLVANSGAVGKELVGVLRAAGTFTDKEKADFDAYFNSKEGQQSLQFVQDRIRQDGWTISRSIDELIKMSVGNKQAWADKINRGAAQLGATPLFDPEQLRALKIKNDQDWDDLAVRWAELGGNPDEIQAKFNAAQQTKNRSSRDAVVNDFLLKLTKDDEKLLQAVADLRSGPKRANLTRALANVRDTGDKGRAARELVKQILGPDVNVGTELIDEAINEYGRSVLIQDETTRVTIAEKKEQLDKKREADAKSGAKGRNGKDKTDSLEKLLKELMGLPTEEELMLATARIQLDVRNSVSEYYDMPLQGLVKELDALEIDFREKMLSAQDKFKGFYVNTLTQGLDGMMNDPVMADAFSGRLLQRIKSNGSADVFGKQFTAAMVDTTQGLNEFIQRIQSEFAKGAQGSEGGQQRIEQAGRMLRGMTDQVMSEFDLFSEQFQVLRIKHAALVNEMREFSEDFNREQLIRNFENLLMADATGAKGASLDLIIEVGIQAKTSRIILDTENAIRQLREKYQDAFANIGVETTVNTKTGRLELLERMATAPGAVGGGYAAGATTTGNIPQAVITAAATAATQSLQRFRSPVPGRITGGYGDRRALTGAHMGIDLRAAIGTEIVAPLDGVIKEIGDTLRGGKQMAIDHGNGLVTAYAHLSRKLLAPGTVVRQGEAFALSGNTGINPRTGRNVDPHVHMGARQGGARINPQSLMGRNVNVITRSGQGRTPEQVAYDNVRAQLPLEQQIVAAKQRGQEILRKQLETRLETRDALIKEYNAEVDNLIAIQDARIKWLKTGDNAAVLIEEEHAATRLKIWEETEGKIYDIRIAMAQRTADALARTAEARASGFSANQYGTGNGVGGEALRNQFIANAKAKAAALEVERATAVAASRAEGNARQRPLEEQLIIEGEINRTYAERNRLLTEGIEAQRAAYEEAVKYLEEMAHGNGNTGDDIFLGLNAALLNFAATVPTVFETMRDLGTTALQGIADVGAGILTGTEKNAKEAVANILRSMAQLLAKMVVMYAMIQLINLVPGGPAILKAMDLGAGLGGRGAGGAAGGAGAAAFGHTAESFMPMPRAKGGIARSPELTIFGEGRTPEAFIPMEDHRSIPVRIDENGNAFVPLPSGQTIPVTLQGGKARKFADGGIGRYSKMQAVMADSVSPGNHDAVAPWRRSPGTSNANVSNRTMISVPVTINGNASGEDADRIGNEVAKRIDALMREREAENARQYQRRGMSIGGSEYGAR